MKLKVDEEGAPALEDGKPVYLNDDGSELVFDADEAFEKINALNRENAKRRKELEAISKRVMSDEDAEELERLRAEARKREEEHLEAKGEFEKLRERWQEEQKDKEASWAEKVQTLESKVLSFERDSKIEKVAIESGLDPKLAKDVRILLVSQGRIQYDDGKFTVLDESGNALPDDLNQFFSDRYRKERPAFYVARAASGSGAVGGNGSTGKQKVLQREAFDRLPLAEQGKFVRDGGTVTD